MSRINYILKWGKTLVMMLKLKFETLQWISGKTFHCQNFLSSLQPTANFHLKPQFYCMRYSWRRWQSYKVEASVQCNYCSHTINLGFWDRDSSLKPLCAYVRGTIKPYNTFALKKSLSLLENKPHHYSIILCLLISSVALLLPSFIPTSCKKSTDMNATWSFSLHG